MSDVKDSFNIREYLQNKIATFNDLITWNQETRQQFSKLLLELKLDNSETTKQKGDKLERLVTFILQNSFFYEVFKNIHTETNEIDQVIVKTKIGIQTMHEVDFCANLLPLYEDVILGECKNYASRLNVTYVGKFYSLLKVTGVKFGIIFTQNGLTGSPEGYQDAYGLIKVLRLVEETKGNENFFIIVFTLEDYERMLQGVSFYDLVKAKILEVKLASKYENFLVDNKHSCEDEIKDMVSSVCGKG